MVNWTDDVKSAAEVGDYWTVNRENLGTFEWNDLPVGREFDGKVLKNVKSPPHALPPPRSPTLWYLLGALTINDRGKHAGESDDCFL